MFSDDLGFNPFDKKNDDNFKSTGPIHATRLRDKFLESFNQSHIYTYNGNPRKKISSMNHTSDLMEALQANINNNSDVYFYINGGRKMYAINTFTCCFCDMDAGRDNEGKYFKPSVVMQKKKAFLKKINSFPVAPSWVVDTRNGYQCYWIFDDHSRKLIGKNKTYWNGLQKKLVNYFGGDPRAIKANQIYRVPYTWWRKGWEKKAPYFTSILNGSTGAKVSAAELQSALTGQPATVVIDPAKCSDNWYKGYAKAYKQADENGIPVAAEVASQILNDLTNDYNKKLNKCSSFNKFAALAVNTDEDDDSSSDDAGVEASGQCLDSSGEQTRLLKTVVEFLNQVSTPLYFSNNRFLSSAAKELANKLSDHFCIG